jgi:hypothetical protein
MVVFTVGDVDIQFPFVPYDVQKELMKKVLECIQKVIMGYFLMSLIDLNEIVFVFSI